MDGAEGFRAKFRPAGRQVLEEVGFHADLEAGDWQRADKKEQPNGTATGMSWVCVMPRSTSDGWRRGLDFSVNIDVYPTPVFLAHTWGGIEALSWDLTVKPKALGYWALPPRHRHRSLRVLGVSHALFL